MTIIFANHLDEDCKTITTLWRDWTNYKLIEILPTTKDADYIVDKAIENEEDTLILIGHGTTHGLLHPDFRGEYLVHDENVNLIKAKRVFCSWCYASTFCERNKLKSFSTSMFISNVGEACDNCIYGYTQEQINAVGARFDSDMSYLIQNNVPMNEWQMFIGARMDVDDAVDTFNRQGVFYLND